MKLQKSDFYQSVLEMNLNPNKKHVYATVDVGLKEARYIAERCYWEDYLDPLGRMVGQCMNFRHGIITGYDHFVKYDVNEDLTNLVSNTESMLYLKHNLINCSVSDKDIFDSKAKGKGPVIYEPRRISLENSLFYQSVLRLERNANKTDVTKSYLVGINEVQTLMDGIYSSDEDSQFRSLLKHLINWRYAHIEGYDHFRKHDLHNNLSMVSSNVGALINSQKKKVRDNKFWAETRKRWEQEEKEERRKAKEEKEKENGTSTE